MSSTLARLAWGACLIVALLIPVCLVYGFPVTFLAWTPIHAKSLRKLFEISFVLFSAGVALHPRRREILTSLRTKGERIAGAPQAIWVLTGVYFLLFLWVQVTKYFALEINFIPFLFYDYMLWFFEKGKFCYTGFLHGYYHLNLGMLLLLPIWKMVRSSWVLHVAHPLFASAAAAPLFYWAKDRMENSLAAFVVSFAYLNFRYVQNLVDVGFVVEIFYPFFIFSAVCFASRGKRALYYMAVVLGLLVKEDSAIYFGALGAFFLFGRSTRLLGFWTILLSAAYLLLALKVFLPWSGSNILGGDIGNYRDLGSQPMQVVSNVLRSPWGFIKELFVPLEKVRTFVKLTSKLLFLPLCSPWFILVIAAIYPVFFRSVNGNLFLQLSLFYSAAVLPFLFMAFVDGWRRIGRIGFVQKKPLVQWVIMILVIFLNGFNLRPLHFTRDDMETIRLAKGIPQGSVVIAQGHLLPYLGYRQWNFYLSPHYETNKLTKDAYLNPDYYLFDFGANSYPLTPEQLRDKADLLRNTSGFKVLFEDHRRLLLQREK